MPQTLLAPTTKEVVVDAASGGAWVNRTLRQVIKTGVNGSTSGDIHNSISVIELSWPVLNGIVVTYPPCGLNVSQEVGNKWKSTSPGLVGQYQKLDAIVDGNFPNDIDLTSISAR